jgi:hypothetical protein
MSVLICLVFFLQISFLFGSPGEPALDSVVASCAPKSPVDNAEAVGPLDTENADPVFDSLASELPVAFRRLLNSSESSSKEFSNLARKLYKLNFIKSVKMFSKENWPFKCAFLHSINLLPSIKCSQLAQKGILQEIRLKFQMVFSDMSQKEAHFEALNLLIEIAQTMPITPSIKARKEFAALKFVLKNISFDYSKTSIDYSSLRFTFKKILRKIPTNGNIIIDQDLFNWSSLLTAYLPIISKRNCMEIYENSDIHRIRPQLLYLILNSKVKGISCFHFEFSYFHSDVVEIILSSIRTFIPVQIKSFLSTESSQKYRISIHSKPDISNLGQLAKLKILEIQHIIDNCKLRSGHLWLLKAAIVLKRYLLLYRIK